jgi:hypothetical protein
LKSSRIYRSRGKKIGSWRIWVDKRGQKGKDMDRTNAVLSFSINVPWPASVKGKKKVNISLYYAVEAHRVETLRFPQFVDN